MKKLIVIAILFAAPFGVSANALELKPYVSEKISFSRIKMAKASSGGVSWTNHGSIEKDSVFGSKLALGFSVPADAIHGSIRGEFEWGINGKASMKNTIVAPVPKPTEGLKIDLNINTFQLNAYYDINTETAFIPYVSAGVGFANIRT
ncbi:MAG: hypothetical protein LBE98_03635 [Puniceicoccales bacterium]|jgi:opacity protein-like surface antigen|nr:hypothetical protein [Puniceicoccales bacterium]